MPDTDLIDRDTVALTDRIDTHIEQLRQAVYQGATINAFDLACALVNETQQLRVLVGDS